MAQVVSIFFMASDHHFRGSTIKVCCDARSLCVVIKLVCGVARSGYITERVIEPWFYQGLYCF